MSRNSHIKVGHVRTLMFFVCLLLLSGAFLLPKSYAHLEHTPHYNGGGQGLSKYYVIQGLDPEYVQPNQPAKIIFSVEDYFQNDVHNIETMVEIYEADTGQRIMAYPWTKHDVGDFEVDYTFPHKGNYQLVLSLGDESTTHSGIDSSREILSSNLNCNCVRVIFNISVSENIGSIFVITWAVSITSAIIILGVVLGQIYKNRKKSGLYQNSANKEVLKYSIILAALAAGLVHLAVYDQHASLNLYYSIFLLLAALGQIAYGAMYLSINISNIWSSKISKELIKLYYRKTMIINLIGLVGTGVLLGLYTYSVIFPPPLSHTNQPEDIDYAGILSKSVEVFTFIGIILLIRWERKKFHDFVGINKFAR